jgi:hypothetical protein
VPRTRCEPAHLEPPGRGAGRDVADLGAGRIPAAARAPGRRCDLDLPWTRRASDAQLALARDLDRDHFA